MFAWIGLALLSVSWLLGLDYYHGVRWIPWTITIAAGTAMLATRQVRMPGWKVLIAALVMTVPAVWLMPWPYRAAAALVGSGLVLALAAAALAPVRRWLVAAGGTCLLAGSVLLSQALAMSFYAYATSRSHTLRGPLPRVIAAALRGLGINTGVHDATVAVFSMRKNHLFTATWELLLDPPTWCFLVGGIVILWWKSRTDLPQPGRIQPWRGPVLKLAILVALWLPVRAALLIAIYLDNVLRVDYDAPLDAMKLFWNPWLLLAMLTGPVLLAWRFTGAPRWTNRLQTGPHPCAGVNR